MPDATEIAAQLHLGADRGVSTDTAREMGAQGVSVVICTYRRPDSLAALLDSLAQQQTRPRELLIVDASVDEEARPTRVRLGESAGLATRVHYWQVTGSLRGLTHQRNFALRHVTSDLVLFLDDDVTLYPECIREMEAVHRSGGREIVGVGCYSDNQFEAPPLLWRIRRALKLVPSLEPGRYWRSGISTPWGFKYPAGEIVDGDWLPGSAMMWKTDVVRAIGFDDALEGYAQGEDLDFSLRARARGRLVMLGTPRMRHRHASGGRPDAFRLGYMELRYRYEIHRRALVGRTWRDVALFSYAWAIDTVLLLRHLAIPGRFVATLRQIAGRVRAAADLCAARGRITQLRNAR